jgi:hypothetical protein
MCISSAGCPFSRGRAWRGLVSGLDHWEPSAYEVRACVAYGHGSMRIRASGTSRVTNN